MDTDSELLRRYTDHGDENAFAEVVRRHANLVYSVALRVTNNPPLAEDATQAVFTKLVHQARLLGRYQTIIGWLHTITRHTAIDILRSEKRRRTREHEAITMHIDSIRDEANWAQLRPMLDEAVSRLNPRDREAVLLRFFSGLSHQEVGAALGLTENSANKRIERALEKLRAHFNRRGLAATSATLAATMSMNSVQAAPAGLAANVTKGALSSAPVTGTLGAALSLIFFFMSTKTKAVLAVIILAAVVTAIALKLSSSSPAITTTRSPVASVPAAPASQPKASGTATVVAPAAPAATSAAKPATSATDTATSPAAIARKELNARMDEIIATLQAGDFTKAYETYLSPQTFAGVTPADNARQEQQMLAIMATPKGQQAVQQLIQWLGEMKGQSPTFNPAGDRATFSIPNPPDMGIFPPELTFRKVDGKWYAIPPHSLE